MCRTQEATVQIALYLTLGRLLLGPLFLLVYLYYSYFGISFAVLPYVLLALLLVSEISDMLDGFFARKWNQVTELGKVLDPMADSIARISVFLTFTQGIIQLPLLLVFIFLPRFYCQHPQNDLCFKRNCSCGENHWED